MSILAFASRFTWVTILFVTWASSLMAIAQDRIALVVGAAKYEHAEILNSPENDATEIAAILQSKGFKIVTGEALLNPTLDSLNDALKSFRDAQTEGAFALFYFSGHGVDINGANYLVPVDADYSSPDDVKELWAVSDVVDKMRYSKAGHYLLILDACRDDPFESMHQKGLERSGGLAATSALPNMVHAYAALPGSTASDGPSNGLSLYSEVLSQYLSYNFRVLHLFDYVSTAVWERSGQRQLPKTEFSNGVSSLYLYDQSAVIVGANPDISSPVADQTVFMNKGLSSPEGVDELSKSFELARTYITAFEPFKPKATRSHANGMIDQFTIGYGRTSNVAEGDVTTFEQEDEFVTEQLNVLSRTLDQSAPAQYSAQQRGALLSFMYSIGAKQWRSSSLKNYLNDVSPTDYDPQRISELMSAWTNVNVDDEEIVSPALVARRSAEAVMFHTGAPTTRGELGAFRLIKQFEGFSSVPYSTPGSNLRFIGYGQVIDPQKDAQFLSADAKPISEFEASVMLVQDIRRLRQFILRQVDTPLTSQQLGALISFVSNVGEGNFQNSTLLKRLNEGSYLAATDEFRRWIFAGGDRLPGLEQLRRLEIAMFLSSIPPELYASGDDDHDELIRNWVRENEERL